MRLSCVVAATSVLIALSAFATNEWAPDWGAYKTNGRFAGTNWTNLDSTKVSDNKYAKYATGTSDPLTFDSLGINVRDGVTVDSVLFIGEGQSDGNNTTQREFKACLLIAGSPSVDTVTDSWDKNVDSTGIWRGATNGRWGSTITAANLRAANTGLKFWKTSADGKTQWLDYLALRIYFSEPDSTWTVDVILYDRDTLRPILDNIRAWGVVGANTGALALDEVSANDADYIRGTFADDPGINSTMGLPLWEPVNLYRIDTVIIHSRSERTGGTQGKTSQIIIDSDGDEVTLGDTATEVSSYTNWVYAHATDPNTSAAWVKDSINNYAWGVNLAQKPGISQEVRVSQWFLEIVHSRTVRRQRITVANDTYIDGESTVGDSTHNDNSTKTVLKFGKPSTGGAHRTIIQYPSGLTRSGGLVYKPDSINFFGWFDKTTEIGSTTRSVLLRGMLRSGDFEFPGYSDWVHRQHTNDSWYKTGADSAIGTWGPEDGDITSTGTKTSIAPTDTAKWVRWTLPDSAVNRLWIGSYGVRYGIVLRDSAEANSLERGIGSEDGTYKPFFEVWSEERKPIIGWARPTLGYGLRGLDTASAKLSLWRHGDDPGVIDSVTIAARPNGASKWGIVGIYTGADISAQNAEVFIPWTVPQVQGTCSLQAVMFTSTGQSDSDLLVITIDTAQTSVYDVSELADIVSSTPNINNGYPIVANFGDAGSAEYRLLFKGFNIPATPEVPAGKRATDVRWYLRLHQFTATEDSPLVAIAARTTEDWWAGNETNGTADSGDVSWDSAVTTNHATYTANDWTTPGGTYSTTDLDTSVAAFFNTGATEYTYIDVTNLRNGDSIVGGVRGYQTATNTGFKDTSATTNAERPKIVAAYNLIDGFPPVGKAGDNVWAHAGVFTAPSSGGTVTVTGLPGTPSAIMLQARHNTNETQGGFSRTSVGFVDVGALPLGNYCVAAFMASGFGKNQNSKSIGRASGFLQWAVSGNEDAEGYVSAATADGFQVTISDPPASDIYVNYLAYGGPGISDVDVQIVQGTLGSSTTVNVGFQPTILFLAGHGGPTWEQNGGGLSSASDCYMNFGVAHDSATQVCASWKRINRDAINPLTNFTPGAIYYNDDRQSQGNPAPTITFGAFTATGYRIWTSATGNTSPMMIMVMNGADWDVGNGVRPTSATPNTYVTQNSGSNDIEPLGVGMVATSVTGSLIGEIQVSVGVASEIASNQSVVASSAYDNGSAYMGTKGPDSVYAGLGIALGSSIAWQGTIDQMNLGDFRLSLNTWNATAGKLLWWVLGEESGTPNPPMLRREKVIETMMRK